MSLAAIIAANLHNGGVTFSKKGRELSVSEVSNAIKDILCEKVLANGQGGLRPEIYFCDKCADRVQEG